MQILVNIWKALKTWHTENKWGILNRWWLRRPLPAPRLRKIWNQDEKHYSYIKILITTRQSPKHQKQRRNKTYLTRGEHDDPCTYQNCTTEARIVALSLYQMLHEYWTTFESIKFWIETRTAWLLVSSVVHRRTNLVWHRYVTDRRPQVSCHP